MLTVRYSKYLLIIYTVGLAKIIIDVYYTYHDVDWHDNDSVTSLMTVEEADLPCSLTEQSQMLC